VHTETAQESPQSQRVNILRSDAGTLRSICDADAIAFTPATSDGLDPMLSLWESAAQAAFLQRFAAGERSPRRMLQAVRLRTITPHDPTRLLDRNTPMQDAPRA